MSNQFTVLSWNETPLSENPKRTHASVQLRYTGELEGESKVDYLMVYLSEQEAVYTGSEQFHGTRNGEQTALTWQLSGQFAGGVASSKGQLVLSVPNGLALKLSTNSPHGGTSTYTLSTPTE